MREIRTTVSTPTCSSWSSSHSSAFSSSSQLKSHVTKWLFANPDNTEQVLHQDTPPGYPAFISGLLYCSNTTSTEMSVLPFDMMPIGEIGSRNRNYAVAWNR